MSIGQVLLSKLFCFGLDSATMNCEGDHHRRQDGERGFCARLSKIALALFLPSRESSPKDGTDWHVTCIYRAKTLARAGAHRESLLWLAEAFDHALHGDSKARQSKCSRRLATLRQPRRRHVFGPLCVELFLAVLEKATNV